MDIKIRIVPNPLYGQEGSQVTYPYMAEVISTGSVGADEICAACKADNPQLTEPLASLATETILDYGTDRVVDGVVRFSLGSDLFTLEPAVAGSVPTLDASLGTENEPYINVIGGNALKARLAALRPVIVNDDLGDVQFHSVEATHGGEHYKNTIFEGENFVVIGKRLGGADQTMQLRDSNEAVKSTATFVSGDTLGQRFTYKLATPPADSFRGKLVLVSKGKDTPAANPKTVPLGVDYVHVPPTQKPLKFYPTAQAALDPTSGEEMSEVDRSKTTLYLNAAGAEIKNGDVLNAKLVPTGGGDPLTTTVTVVKGETTMNAPAIDLPFCEPAYTDVYGMMTFENAAVKGDIEMVAM